MNLTKLFETQDKLDERIIEEKGLQGQDLLDKKILALQVELGELANEWRGFKFWSEDQEPRGYNIYTEGKGVEQKNPMLEEYVDCLHFILSIGNDVDLSGYMDAHDVYVHAYNAIVSNSESIDFNNVFICIANFADSNSEQDLRILLIEFIQLGKLLGFTWEQIEAAYYEKNEINHARQENGY